MAALSRAEAASLLAWWLEAGVDTAIGDAPRNWLQKRADPGGPVDHQVPLGSVFSESGEPAEPGPTTVLSRPTSLEAFHAWLAETSELPLFRAGAARALPHGPAGAEVMLIGGIPLVEDSAEGRPIGGAAYALAIRMLAAIGVAPEQAYFAALTCFSNEGRQPSRGELEACREGILHHVALVQPRRLLLLGEAPARLLLGQGLADARGRVHHVQGIAAVATFPPRHLLARSAEKALAWRDLLLLMGETF